MSDEKLIGFYDYYYDEYEYSRRNGKLVVDSPANDIQRFFSNETVCPFCNTTLITVFTGDKHITMTTELSYSGTVLECPNCSWWTYKTIFSDCKDCLDSANGVYSEKKYYGITKCFDIDDKNLPIDVLNVEISNRPELVYKITPKKLEELAQDILRGVYECEVLHVGQTGDGGKDLIILNSDSPMLVQVKQRQNPEKSEQVKGVREFVGTLYIEDCKKGIYISTANKFSKSSIKTAKQLLDSRKLEYFELIDYDKLKNLIINRPNEKIWNTLIQDFSNDPCATIFRTD